MAYLFTSESVSEGHPDKVADQISDAILDAIFTEDPNARVACETFVTTGLVIVGGEITTTAYVDFDKVVRDTIRRIGYVDPLLRFDADSCGVLNAVHSQSPDIAQGVDVGGAGDQGMMFGYASDETPEYMPMPLVYSHRILRRLADVRRMENSPMPYLRPDSKSQVTIEYGDDGKPARVHTIVVSTQHEDVFSSQEEMQQKLLADLKEHVFPEVIPSEMLDENVIYHVNPTGAFVIGGPHGDTGLTGRKIIVDTYGGKAPHGGGAFSGKDPSKVDRSAAYATRHLAKNVVAAGLARECTIQVAYAIGVSQPVSIHVDTHGTGVVDDLKLSQILQNEVDMSPAGIIKRLELRRPIYEQTAAYGHFGRDEEELSWERLDLVDMLKSAVGEVGAAA
ncbi:MAG: methionine adenosyltransferase [Ignavibacteriae bacterium]|nr:methionine adenosyltransferase [Ignavibacteriota bacterium]MCB9216171.1 methionine adenosyltransferase [Ignavibacteria bacterium]